MNNRRGSAINALCKMGRKNRFEMIRLCIKHGDFFARTFRSKFKKSKAGAK